jgi:enoyl-[acyl-carrier protein] reductase II
MTEDAMLRTPVCDDLGVDVRTRFLATSEMAVDQSWKDRIVAADAAEAVKVVHAERVMPPFTIPQIGQAFVPRCLRTPLTDQLEADPDSVDPAQAGPQLVQAILEGCGHEFLPFTGQSAALVHDVVPATELMARLLDEMNSALERVNSVATTAG